MKMEKNDFKETLLEYIKTIVGTIVVTLLVLHFIQISRVVGDSMLPTYHSGNIVLVDKVFYDIEDVKHNDIVVAKYVDEQIIKRVVAIPGDHIACIDNQLYLNGELLDEPYINEKMEYKDFAYDVPDGKLFIMGDNRNHSIDSRVIGYIDFEDEIIGRVFFKVF